MWKMGEGVQTIIVRTNEPIGRRGPARTNKIEQGGRGRFKMRQFSGNIVFEYPKKSLFSR